MPGASGRGGILYTQDEECPGRVHVAAGYPTPLRVFPGLLVMVGSHRWTPLVQADEGVSPAWRGRRGASRLGSWWSWVFRLPVCGAPFLPLAGSARMAWASRWDSPHLPCAAGTSLLNLASVSRLGVRKYQAWVTFAGWGVGRHPVAVLFQSGIVFHLPQFSVGSPVSYLQGLWLCPMERSRERLVHAIVS